MDTNGSQPSAPESGTNTGRVSLDNAARDGAEGFSYTCTECNTPYIAKRPIIIGKENPFCSDKCRYDFHRKKRQKRKAEKA